MTARQFYITFIIMVVSTKMQRFPVLLFSEFGKDGYLMILGYALINILGILLAFFIYKYVNQNAKTENKVFIFIKKFIMFVTSIYFLIQALILYLISFHGQFLVCCFCLQFSFWQKQELKILH